MSTMTPAQLRAIDRRIAEAVIDEALRLNYLISVHDGEVFALKRSKDKAAVLSARPWPASAVSAARPRAARKKSWSASSLRWPCRRRRT